MNKQILAFFISCLGSVLMVQVAYGNSIVLHIHGKQIADSASNRNEVVKIINTVIKASSTFDVNAVTDLYTPNAVVADEEPPFSWNGPTAGVQWISTVEKTCKDYKMKNFNAKIRDISVYLQTDESIYVVVPVDYTGEIKGDRFDEEGAFTFIFRLVNGHWLIKSQVWVARKGM
ncbi:nuclear transport factor 2 family protein [Mucilaginibacter sp. BT774]|uniref:nuclear transport factor 2 family protein n=1 Tax=Mucilaginibacter sp. BT774 TaxID=3062276 RepID=UPI0026769224|nr:nuclear transport factor 2 family protein [Mucilaginibacter sp. BT774]MDO3626576.1 nuclear transport factor 2 family protein [Mucilaginibacter sp. BT774]